MPTLAITPTNPNIEMGAPKIGGATSMPTVQVAFCQKVEREIKRYGVEEAMKRWRVICDYLQTEDWFPPVVREVETAFDTAFDERNRQLAETASRQTPSSIQLTINQQQGDMGTNNQFGKDSNCQVFNGEVKGQFV